MYLRLKTHCPRGPATSRQGLNKEAAAPLLRDELLRRHYAAFDWHHGGPPGAIKFIDLHQLELAAHLARAGDDRAVTMVQRYARGLEKLVCDPAGGAAHYATGLAWNTPGASRTLSGQAVAIQALATIGGLERSCAHVRVVAQLTRFVAAGYAPSASDMAQTFAPPHVASRICEHAWYVTASGAFAELYDHRRLRTDALAGFEYLADKLCAREAEFRQRSGALSLADRVAIAGLAIRFRGASGGREFGQFARRALAEGASHHAHPDGGWVQTYRDGVPPDLDSSIDLVRNADALRADTAPALARIAADGKRALFKPEFALARMPESGLLMLCAEASAEYPSHRGNRPAGPQLPGFAGNRDELLVNAL